MVVKASRSIVVASQQEAAQDMDEQLWMKKTAPISLQSSEDVLMGAKVKKHFYSMIWLSARIDHEYAQGPTKSNVVALLQQARMDRHWK